MMRAWSGMGGTVTLAQERPLSRVAQVRTDKNPVDTSQCSDAQEALM